MIFSLLISWTKTLKWRGLNFFVMSVEKIAPVCFGAKRNMKRHVKNVHKARDNETSRNSNRSNTDEPIDVNNVEFDIARD